MIPLLQADDREPADELGLAAAVVRPPLRAAFREDLRRRVRAAATERIEPRRSFAWRHAFAAATLVLLLVGMTAPLVAHAAAGDALFDVKLTLEAVERSLASDDAGLVSVLASQAERRHDELLRLLDEGSPNVSRAAGAYVAAISRLTDAAATLASRAESDRDRAALARALDALATYRALVDARDLDSGLGPARGRVPTRPTETSGPFLTSAPLPTAQPPAEPTADGATASPAASVRPRATPAIPPDPPGPHATPAVPPQR